MKEQIILSHLQLGLKHWQHFRYTYLVCEGEFYFKVAFSFPIYKFHKKCFKESAYIYYDKCF